MAALRSFCLAALCALLSSCPPPKVDCQASAECGDDQTCVDGACQGCPGPCGEGTFCARGQCVSSQCGDQPCPAGQVCQNDRCIERQCLDAQCGAGELCLTGTCYPTSCAGTSCGEGRVCVNEVCEEAACVGLTCIGGEVCAGGACMPQSCPGIATCAVGAVCEDERCVHKACVGVSCPLGNTCVAGKCLTSTCGGVDCAAGAVCENGVCVDKSCDGLTCEGTATCHRGACSECSTEETVCGDGIDNDCDGNTDCADSACGAQACDDGDPCTLGEVCGAGVCGGGAAKSCTEPPAGGCFASVGTCDSTTGSCVYDPKPAGALCNQAASCLNGQTCDGAGACAGSNAVKCNTPPSQCMNPTGTCNAETGVCVYTLKAPGSSCTDLNACTMGDSCDASGVCVPGTAKACNSPPNTGCWKTAGVCNKLTGACGYKPQPTSVRCNDGNACTVGEHCNGEGACGGGTTCPNSNPCKNARCSDGKCVLSNKGNGTQCGSAEASRCCGGTCVNIASNTRHCGGCGLDCANGESCRSVSIPSGCSPSPSNTSGRCTCDDSRECPGGQICRLQQARFNNFCAPQTNSDCASGEVKVEVSSCPNFCRYP